MGKFNGNALVNAEKQLLFRLTVLQWGNVNLVAAKDTKATTEFTE